MKIAIHEAKAKLSGLINAALGGEQVQLTKHGKPVAEIRPFAGAKRRQTNWLPSGRLWQKPVQKILPAVLRQMRTGFSMMIPGGLHDCGA